MRTGDKPDAQIRKKSAAKATEAVRHRRQSGEGDAHRDSWTPTDALPPVRARGPARRAVRFVVANNGKVLHEMMIGTLDGTAGARRGDEEVSRTWSTTSPTWRTCRRADGGDRLAVHRAGEFDFACLIPGHFEAGMVGKIIVK